MAGEISALRLPSAEGAGGLPPGVLCCCGDAGALPRDGAFVIQKGGVCPSQDGPGVGSFGPRLIFTSRLLQCWGDRPHSIGFHDTERLRLTQLDSGKVRGCPHTPSGPLTWKASPFPRPSPSCP